MATKNESPAPPPSDAKAVLGPMFDEFAAKVQRTIDAGEGDVTVQLDLTASCAPRRSVSVREKVTFAKPK